MAVELEFDPFAPEIRANPYPTYQQMREQAPIYWSPDGSPMLTRYEDISTILRDHERWSNDGSKSKYAEQAAEDSRVAGSMFGALNARPMLFTDPPDHTRIRGLVNKAFTPKAVDRLRPRMESIVDELLDEVAGAGAMDIIQHVAYPLPVIMIAELLGVPASDRELLKSWSEPLARTIDPLDDRLEPEFVNELLGAGLAFISYFAQLINERRASPGEDLLSALVAAEEQGDRLTQEEVIVNLILLLIAGHETTTNLIGNGMLALLRHPDATAELRDDPAMIKTAVEELLRYDSPVQLDARTALEDIEVAGVTIPKKEQPILLLAAANRDPAQFPDPDRLDLRRAPNAHLAFSSGIHFCVGASLARAEGQVAINAMLRRFPKLALVNDEQQYKANVTLRGLAELPGVVLNLLDGIPYGDQPDQIGDLYLPADDGPHPLVVILHGGFWRHVYDRAYIRPLAEDLARRGYAAWNLEFRRMGEGGAGGFPMTLDDVASGIDAVDASADDHGLDRDRVAVVGHSAGGHLALWAAGRANPLIEPAVVFALAPVADLRLCYDLGLSDGAVKLFMGGTPDERPDAYAMASPAERLPTGVRQVVVHGRADENVPIEVARRYYQAAVAAGDDVELLEFDTEHLSLVNPDHESWQAVLDRLP